MGGMTKAVASRHAEAADRGSAARRQAMIDRGDEVIVGVNKYRKDNEDPIDILDIDNAMVRDAQVARLEKIRATRDEAACRGGVGRRWNAALARKVETCWQLAVEAARARASVGEISMAMEKEFGRHRAEVKTLAGVYGAAYEGDEGFAAIQKIGRGFRRGRRPPPAHAGGQDGPGRP